MSPLPAAKRLMPCLAAVVASGCLSLRPFEEVRREQPAVRFVVVGGQQVYVEQQGMGEPVVLLHGFGASSYSWRKVIPELAKSFHVVALDLNGFGYTERPRDPASYTREGQERLILGAVDALGLSGFHLVGHSYGGSLALFIASREPRRLRSLVLVDSAAPTYPEDRRSRLAAVRPLGELLLRLALRPGAVRRSLAGSFYDAALATPELARAYFDRLCIEGEDDAYFGLTAPTRPGVQPFRVDISRIELPTLIVWGAEDRLIKLEAGRSAARRMPRAEFVVMEKTGHLPMEEHPLELVRIVQPFLARHSAGGDPQPR